VPDLTMEEYRTTAQPPHLIQSRKEGSRKFEA
jgi:hypothetical protein